MFAGFEVQREAQVLRIRSGLLARRAISIPLERVDGVVIVEGLARGPLGLAALRLESAAHGGEQAAGRTLLPLVRRSEAEAVIARLVPALALAPGELERPPRRALRRFVLAPALGGRARRRRARARADARRPGRPRRCSRSRARSPACARTAPAACAWRATSSSCARRASRGARCSRAATACRSTRLRHTPLQARAALADLRVTVGSGGQGRARHLERATAEAVFGALRRARPAQRRRGAAA